MTHYYNKHDSLKKTALATAIALAMSGGPSSADIYTFSFGPATANPLDVNDPKANEAFFTMLDPNGNPLANTSYPYYGDLTWGYGLRTQIAGSLTIDTADNSGTVSISPFQFFNGNPVKPATASGIAFVDAGSDPNNGDPLVLANMLFDWNGNNGIPVALVWDIKGLIDAINGGLTVGDTVTGGATIASDGIKKGSYPVGPAPVATTTWDATDTCTPTTAQTPPPTGCMTVNPIGALPLIADTTGGDPMADGPFPDFSANFDFATLTLSSFTDTTPPVITLGGSNPTNLAIGDTYTETATCIDAIDGDLTGGMTVGGGPVNTGTAGSFTLTYDCTDLSTNAATQKTRTVNVSAANTPVISLLGSNPLTHQGGSAYSDPGATCADPTDGDIPLGTNSPPQMFAVTSNTVNANLPGTYAVTYDCTNSAGILAPTASRTVDVVDTIPPVITLNPTCPITQVADGTDPTPTATATDLVDGIVPVTQNGVVNPNPSFGSDLSRVFNLGFNATDAAGNISVGSCDVTLGNPLPVGTLLGNATVVLSSGGGGSYVEAGATCADFVDGALQDATADMVIDSSTPDGSYTITYTCGPNSGGQTGSVTRSVILGAPFSATSDSGSTFSMIDPDGKNVGGADDIFFSWTGSLYTTYDPATQTPNMFMGSAEPQPFFGFPWVAHDIKAFGPGSYTIGTSRGNTLQLQVNENQIGTHMLFDWNGNNDIDVVLTWDFNGVFAGSPAGVSDDQGSRGVAFSLTAIDVDGDGSPGTPMADGPFAGFNANFNIKLTPQFALPDSTAIVAQDSNNPTSVIVSTADPVTITATVNPDVNGAYTYAGPFTYDWSSSDAGVLAGNTNGTTSATFVFNPSGLADGTVNVVGKVTDSATGLTSTVTVPLRVVSGVPLTDPSVHDSDSDGIPDSQDAVDNNVTPGVQQTVSGNGSSFLAMSSAGTLTPGDLAAQIGAQTGAYQIGVTASDIAVTDSGVEGSCVGSCFSFKVNGVAPGSAVDVVLPLSEAIPADAGIRKFVNGSWRDFDTTNGNAIMSATGSAGSCPTPGGSWTGGLTEGDFCLKLTIVDGGANDTDGLANGTVIDPSGVSGAAVSNITVPSDVGTADIGGCSLSRTPAPAARYAEWWLLGGLLGWLGLSLKRNRRR